MESNNKFSSPVRVTVVLSGAKIFERVFNSYPIVFGRQSTNQIPLEFDYVSRQHGIITEENGQVVISDLQSSNGIYLDGKKIKKITLGDSAQVVVGKLQITLEKITPAAQAKEVRSHTAATVAAQKTITQSKKIPRPTPPVAVAKVSPMSTSAPLPPMPKHETPHKPKALHHTGNSFESTFLEVHPEVLKNPKGMKVVEATITWHDQVYDTFQFGASEKVTVGASNKAALYCPVIKDTIKFADVGDNSTLCFIPQGNEVLVNRSGQEIPMGDLVAKKLIQKNAFGWGLKLDFTDVASLNISRDVKLHLRYIPAPKELVPKPLLYLEKALRAAAYASTMLHVVLLMIAMLTPAPKPTVKLKNVPDRLARLLMEKPKPKPTPPPVIKKEEPKIAKKPEPKKLPPKKIVMKTLPPKVKPPKTIAKVNKYPMTVQHPVKVAPPPVKVEALGALAALGAISPNAQPNTVTNININKNAGGLPTKANIGGIVGALPSTNGTLVAGGFGNVKTKNGKGFGTGSGYGVQGLKGTAGGRSVAGAIVGEPKLAQSGKTEGLTRAQVMAVVKKYAGEIQSCYEKSLVNDPSLRGRMEFEWDISPSGRVTATRIKRSQVNGGDLLGECVKSVIASMPFPRASNGQSTSPSIGFPFGTM